MRESGNRNSSIVALKELVNYSMYRTVQQTNPFTILYFEYCRTLFILYVCTSEPIIWHKRFSDNIYLKEHYLNLTSDFNSSTGMYSLSGWINYYFQQNNIKK